MAEEKNTVPKDIIELLLTKEIISAAQAAVARADVEATQLSEEEVLLMRKWISEETLSLLTPELSRSSSGKAKMESEKENAKRTYRRNLERYREIMSEIMDGKPGKHGKTKEG